MRIPGDPTELDWPSLWDEDRRRYRVQTRDGREVRVWTIDARSDPQYPVRGEYRLHDEWYETSWTLGGLLPPGAPHERELTPVPIKRKMFANVYPGDQFGERITSQMLYESADEARANRAANMTYIGPATVEWEDT